MNRREVNPKEDRMARVTISIGVDRLVVDPGYDVAPEALRTAIMAELQRLNPLPEVRLDPPARTTGPARPDAVARDVARAIQYKLGTGSAKQRFV
jgi:hypothetical protein